MSASQGPYAAILRDLAGLILTVCAEAVAMLKRAAPEQALKLKSTQEWTIYLEFLKVFFNLVDRLSAFYLPLRDRPEFMNSLEDTVSQQLSNVLAPALAQNADQMEVTFTIGRAVAESRQTYERFAFVVTEDDPQKDEFLKFFAERVAHLLNMPGNGLVISSATLCASAIVPALKAAFERSVPPQSGTTAEREQVQAATEPTPPSTGNQIKLVSVMSSMEGEEVETRWGVHPRFRRDLTPEELRELSRLMNRVTRILGERYAAVAFSPGWAPWQQVGHA
ncbi:hypothetical protein [Candidatus Nitrospira bockiana]